MGSPLLHLPPELGSPRPHLHLFWAHPCHSPPGLRSGVLRWGGRSSPSPVAAASGPQRGAVHSRRRPARLLASGFPARQLVVSRAPASTCSSQLQPVPADARPFRPFSPIPALGGSVAPMCAGPSVSSRLCTMATAAAVVCGARRKFRPQSELQEQADRLEAAHVQGGDQVRCAAAAHAAWTGLAVNGNRSRHVVPGLAIDSIIVCHIAPRLATGSPGVCSQDSTTRT